MEEVKTATVTMLQEFINRTRVVIFQTKKKKLVADLKGNYQVHKLDGDTWLLHHNGMSQFDAITAYNSLSKINFDD